ncbi:MAG: hypothetical protein HY220_01365 [Candidatus Sungbacteria bacterium]|uniref:Transcriptional repressor PaaX-like central Cas2-like domain-containing protein n=1 Tax=Candidatus Sungiibacteriota bacterium TaxID=2750080 RepID=A0A9D6QYF6_9BACT|nr:hypothetical protein [Candidatus Sungbacteria bacterium]
MKKGEFAKLILALLASSTIGIAAATIPGAAGILKILFKRKSHAKRHADLARALHRLRKRRMVKFKTKNGKTYLQITESGKTYLKHFELEDLTLNIPEHWDGAWSVILFDIPETKRNGRDSLRVKLRDLDCYQFHKSVFVHPAPCENEIDFITELFRLQPYVTVFRTKSLGRQEYRARRYFNNKLTL